MQQPGRQSVHQKLFEMTSNTCEFFWNWRNFGLTKNAGSKNEGPKKNNGCQYTGPENAGPIMQGWKMQDWKMRDRIKC